MIAILFSLSTEDIVKGLQCLAFDSFQVTSCPNKQL